MGEQRKKEGDIVVGEAGEGRGKGKKKEGRVRQGKTGEGRERVKEEEKKRHKQSRLVVKGTDKE